MLIQLRGASAPHMPTLARTAEGRLPEVRMTDVRVRAAEIADMQRVEPLINGFAARNLMLPKSVDQLVRNFREFVVAEDAHGGLLGCGALRIYSPSLAEIVSLAVSERAHGAGVGGTLVERLCDEARALSVSTVFALTLRDGFFHRLGFRTVPKEMFPLKVWADCRSCPKLHACDEIAVARDLSTSPSPAAVAG
jgi:amino-acid N-acetyltransferase